MARQDFAHNAAPSKTQAPAGTVSALPVVGIILVAVACFSAGYWLGKDDIQQGFNKVDVDAVEAQLAVKDAEARLQEARIETLQALVEQWKAKAGEGAHTKLGELNFYKDLPKQSVMPAPVSAKTVEKVVRKKIALPKHGGIRNAGTITPESVSPTAKKVFDASAYRIQIASFRHEYDALPVQKKIKRAGFAAYVKAVDLGDKGIWFRVYAGPFVSKAVAERKSMRLETEMNIKGLLVRGR